MWCNRLYIKTQTSIESDGRDEGLVRVGIQRCMDARRLGGGGKAGMQGDYVSAGRLGGRLGYQEAGAGRL